MKKVFALNLLLLSITFLFPTLAKSEVLINEFAIDSSPQRVEIINIGSESADISNWYIDDNGGTTYYSIAINTIIHPQSCLMFSYNFNLNKTSADTIRLFDNHAPPTSTSARLIDEFNYIVNPGQNMTYFRMPDGSNFWSSGEASLGFFNKNKESCISSSITPSPTWYSSTPSIPSPTFTATPKPSPIPFTINPSSSNIHISEIMSYPSDGEKEWIELFNGNGFIVDLNDWLIDDIENGGSTPKSFSIRIEPNSYVTITLSSSIFNNDGDSVRLIDNAKNIVESLEYGESTKGRSWGRTDFINDDLCIQEPSLNKSNTNCLASNISPSTASTQYSETSSIKTTNSNTITSNPKPSISSKPYSKLMSSLYSSNSDIIQNQYPVQINNIYPDSDILGLTTDIYKEDYVKKLLKSLTFTSSSFSLLTIASIFFRIKLKSIKHKR